MKWEIVALCIHLHPRYPSQPKLHASPSVVFDRIMVSVTLGTFTRQFPSFAGVASKVISTLYFGSKKNGPHEVFEFGATKDELLWIPLHKKNSKRERFRTVHWWIFWNSACWQIMRNSSLEHVSTLHAYMCYHFNFFLIVLVIFTLTSPSSTKHCSACV